MTHKIKLGDDKKCVIIGLDPIIYLFTLLIFRDCRGKPGNDNGSSTAMTENQVRQ